MSTIPALNNTQILVVDDEPDLRTLYELTLLREGFRVEAAGTVKDAFQLLSERQFDVVITDMRLPDGMGLELIQRIKSEQRSERCVVITAYGSAENAVECLKAGAFDYLTKPVDLKQFRTVIASAALDVSQTTNAVPKNGAQHMATERGTGRRTGGARESPPGSVADASLARMVGESPPMKSVKDRIAKVARSMAPVLVRGESGTGKELAACALHANSHRASGPLIAVNCSAIPETLLEAEFFGSKKGSYTGAAQDRDGFFQAARGGTLFLDEIGDMPPDLQTRLLRVLSDGQFYRVGGHTPMTANVRVIAATHQNLDARVKEGLFREDLYHRLNVIRLRLPALRERREDIGLLLKHFLAKSARELIVDAKRLSEPALNFLSQQEFPGNVRQLENLCHWITVMAPAQTVEIADLPADMRGSGGDKTAAMIDSNWKHALEREVTASLSRGEKEIFEGLNRSFEAALISKALEHTGGRRIEAATLLGIGRNTLTRKIQELGLGTDG